jgi:hypothetical protein
MTVLLKIKVYVFLVLASIKSRRVQFVAGSPAAATVHQNTAKLHVTYTL